MRLLGLTLARSREGMEMRARYGYDPKNPPDQRRVKKEISAFLQNAIALLGADQMEKAGLQREGMSEEKATMSFVEKMSFVERDQEKEAP